MLTIIGIILLVYFTPTLIGLANRHKLLSEIFLTNLFLGWSIVFWVFSFRMAMGWEKTPASREISKP